MTVIGAFPDYTTEFKNEWENETHSSFDTGKVLNSLHNATGPAFPSYVWYCSKVCYKNLRCSYFLLPPKYSRVSEAEMPVAECYAINP